MDRNLLNKPLTFIQTLRLAGVVFSRNVKSMALITLLFFVPMTVAAAAIPQYLRDSANRVMEHYWNGLAAGIIENVDGRMWSEYLLFTCIQILIMAFFSSLAMGAATCATKLWLKGRAEPAEGQSQTVSFSEISGATLSRIWKYLATTLMLYAVIFMSAVLIFPALFFSVALYFVSNVIADTGEWGIAAFRRSYGLVRGRWLQTLLFAAGLWLIEVLIRAVVPVGGNFAVALALNTLSNFLCLFLSVCVSVRYLNLKPQSGQI